MKRGKRDDAQIPSSEVAYRPHFSVCRRPNLAPGIWKDHLLAFFNSVKTSITEMTRAVCMFKKKSELTFRLKIATFYFPKH